MEEDIVTTVLRDAAIKHHIKIDKDDPNVKALVSYALTIGYNNGWKDFKNEHLPLLKILNITSISVINTGGADTIFFETDIPAPIFPYTQNTCLKMESAKHMTDEFLKKYFPKVPVKKINGK